MGHVYQKTVTKPLPAGARIVQRAGVRWALWIDGNGKRKRAVVTGNGRVRSKCATWVAKYRDGDGISREVSTGCKDKAAARAMLASLELRAERVRAGMLSVAEDRMMRHRELPIGEHVEAYITHMANKGDVERWIKQVRGRLERTIEGMKMETLDDVEGERLGQWLGKIRSAGASASVRNGYRSAWRAFAHWCVQSGRLMSHPLMNVPRADERADARRPRRAMTPDELGRLLQAARERPMIEFQTIRRGKRKGEVCGRLRPETRARLERLGWERSLIYKTLVLTGLRRGELASITIGQVVLSGQQPVIVLRAADEKNRQGSLLPISEDLLGDLALWIESKRAWSVGGAGERLFNVPRSLCVVLDRDLRHAGIVKRDDRGMSVDVHALRKTFGTMLCSAGVPLRTAQAAMRHSDPRLTANVYTDPRQLDVAGSLEKLPRLRLELTTNLPK